MSFGLKPLLRSVDFKSPLQIYEQILKLPNKSREKMCEILRYVSEQATNKAATAAPAAMAASVVVMTHFQSMGLWSLGFSAR